jgi:hypothetical protein
MKYTINPDGTIETKQDESPFRKRLKEISGDPQLDPEMLERMSEYDTHKLFK